ncbi:MAG: FecR domain-containing protein, partial [Pyrinomonadaceae bacterium]|nr:FecR domain-containing protein [Pyrinomonadaceae bacterium]
VNFVEGKVEIARKNAKSGYLLKGDELEIGDQVSTGAGGKVEILLNPGSFVRLGENSNFEFATTSLEDLQLKLNSGSAMFEVITDDEFTFAVNTPKAKFFIVKSGIYRVDVLNDGSGKIEVWKGRAQAGDAEIKSGRAATVDGNQAAVVKFDRDDKDALEVWSKSRAKELAKVNARLQNTVARNSLINSFNQTRWSLYNSYGLWVYNPSFGSYCFLPFGYGWSSPYGYYYPRDIWYYNLPPVIYYPPPPTSTLPTLTATGGTRNPRIGNSQSNREGDQTRLTPPFQRVQKDIGQFPSEDQQIDSPSFPTRNPSGTTMTTTTTTTSNPILLPPSAPTKKGGN